MHSCLWIEQIDSWEDEAQIEIKQTAGDWTGEFYLLTAGVFSQNSIHNYQQYSVLCVSFSNLIHVISKGERIK